MLIAVAFLLISAADVTVDTMSIVFSAAARTACTWDDSAGRYICDQTRDVALEVETTTSVLPGELTATFHLRDNEHCLAPGVAVELTANVDGVVLDSAGVVLELDGRATAATLLNDHGVVPTTTSLPLSSSALSLIVTDAPKPLTPCWRVRGVKLTLPVVIAGGAQTITWQADIRRDERSGRIAIEHTPAPPSATSTAPVAPPGYPGFVPAPDLLPQVVATVAGAVVGAGAGVGAVFGLGAVLPGLFEGAPVSAAILVAAGAVVGGWAGNSLVAPWPHPQADAFSLYELDRDEHDEQATADAAVTRRFTAWVALHEEAGVPLPSSSSSSSSSVSP